MALMIDRFIIYKYNILKLTVYKTILRPILTNGNKAWIMTDTDEIFEINVLRRYMKIDNVDSTWKIRKVKPEYVVFLRRIRSIPHLVELTWS